MHNRGQIKWHAFEALYKSSEAKEEIKTNKNRLTMPTLSTDQYEELEETLYKAQSCGSIILILFYRYPKFYKIIDKIKKIDENSKKIYLTSGKVLDTRQIVAIKIKD